MSSASPEARSVSTMFGTAKYRSACAIGVLGLALVATEIATRALWSGEPDAETRAGIARASERVTALTAARRAPDGAARFDTLVRAWESGAVVDPDGGIERAATALRAATEAEGSRTGVPGDVERALVELESAVHLAGRPTPPPAWLPALPACGVSLAALAISVLAAGARRADRERRAIARVLGGTHIAGGDDLAAAVKLALYDERSRAGAARRTTVRSGEHRMATEAEPTRAQHASEPAPPRPAPAEMPAVFEIPESLFESPKPEP